MCTPVGYINMGCSGNCMTVAIITCAILVAITHEINADTADEADSEQAEAPVIRYPYYCVRCICNIINGTTSKLFTNCTEKKFYLPFHRATVVLILQHIRPRLTRVTAYYFMRLERLEYLDLSNNKISTISLSAFRDLRSLKTLLLDGNDFSSLSVTLLTGVFAPLSNLTVLTLHRSIQRGVLGASYLDSKTFADLVSLEYLSMDGIVNMTFDEGFSKLEHLKTLDIGIDGSECNITELTNGSFTGLGALESLTLNRCHITKVDRETFRPLHSLRYLDLSYNKELEISQFGKAAYGLTFTNISVLKLISIHEPLRAGSEILRDDVEYFPHLPVTELYMDDNGIEYIDYGVFSRLPPSIRYLSLTGNKMTFGFYVSEIVFNNPGIEVLDASNQAVAYRTYPTLKIIQKARDELERRKQKKVAKEESALEFREKRDASQEPIRISLQRLICTGSMSNLDFPDFNGTLNNVTYMDLSMNFMPIFRGKEFLGLAELRYLNLSGNYIEIIIDHAMFRDLVRLEVLDMHNNLLGNVLEQNVAIFSHLGQLKHLNLSMNRAYNLGVTAFNGLYALESLDLSENHLSDFNAELSELDRLQNLDLSNNRIDSISANMRDSLDEMAKSRDVRLDLSGNLFSCSCENIPFLRWLVESPVTFILLDQYYCSFNNGSIRYVNSSESLLYNLEEECKSYLAEIVVGSTGLSFLIAFVLCYLTYRNRWKLRYLYYMAKVKIDRNKKEEVDAHFDFDGFLSYADPDRTFVVKDMIQNLEKDAGIRLCIRDRDFDIGEIVAVNISKAIHTSKKTVLLVSRHFLKNKWCNFEMNMARMEAIHTKRDVLIVVFIEEIPANVLPLELIDILREVPSTDVPEDEQSKPAFWQTCLDLFR